MLPTLEGTAVCSRSAPNSEFSSIELSACSAHALPSARLYPVTTSPAFAINQYCVPPAHIHSIQAWPSGFLVLLREAQVPGGSTSDNQMHPDPQRHLRSSCPLLSSTVEQPGWLSPAQLHAYHALRCAAGR